MQLRSFVDCIIGGSAYCIVSACSRASFGHDNKNLCHFSRTRAMRFFSPGGERFLVAKADPLTRSEAALARQHAGCAVKRDYPRPTLQLFSSATREGVAAARKAISYRLK